MWSRREFLRNASVGFSAILAPSLLLGPRRARASGTDPVFVSIYLRGAADGLNLVTPHGDPRYYQLRRTVRVAPGTHLDLDGFFGLNPGFAPLLPLFQSGRLAAIHAAGSPDGSRSHFDAQDAMEFGTPGDPSSKAGWLSRYLDAAGITSSLSAVTLGIRPVKALEGGRDTLAFQSLDTLSIFGNFPSQRAVALGALHAAAGGPMGRAADTANASLDVLGGVDRNTSTVYPNTQFAAAMRDVAALVKADVGLRIAAVDIGGWDHHINQNASLPPLVSALAGGLAAFATDLGSDLDRTFVLVITEFGRRAAENGSGGTDHGHGGVMFALGGGIAGGRVLLRDDTWPGLAPEQMFEGIDLAVTTDFRDVYAEVLDRHLGLSSLGSIFPGYTPQSDRYPGLWL